jgi:hypothetical protein
MWEFQQSTGAILHDSVAKFHGYAGNGAGKDNPAMQDIHNVGPLPRGKYTIGPPHTSGHTGPYTMNLEPDPANEMFGRSAFRIHGDSIAAPGTASNGCIVTARVNREAIWASGDRELVVLE